MAAFRHLGILRFKFFNSHCGQKTHAAPSCQIPWNRCWDIAIFAIFKMAGRHLGFSKTENVNDG